MKNIEEFVTIYNLRQPCDISPTASYVNQGNFWFIKMLNKKIYPFAALLKNLVILRSNDWQQSNW